MGCDIHIYKEKKIKNKWKSIDTWVTDDYGYTSVPYEKSCYKGRNYNFFGLLCDGVRTSHTFSLKERGLPNQVSKEVFDRFKYWGSDAHSTSFLTVEELQELSELLKTSTIEISGEKDVNQLKKLEESINSDIPTDWDLLYPYSKWSSRETDVPFKIDAPASFIIGNDIDTIIKSFEGHDARCCRVVFWFDN